MRRRAEGALARRRESRLLPAAVGAVGGFSATVLFALYNAGAGIWYASLWHGSIGVYYILLSLLRGILLAAERRAKRTAPEAAQAYRGRVFAVTAGMVLAMNGALIIPISLMVLDRRPVRTGLVPAIASAAYTTYKVIAAAAGWRRTGGSVLAREWSALRLTDALVSVLVLQNTLIVAVDGEISPELFQLVALSSAGILLLILAISVIWFVRGLMPARPRGRHPRGRRHTFS